MGLQKEFRNRINFKTEQINKKLTELEAKADKVEDKLKIESYKQIEFLRNKLGQAQSQLDNLKGVNDDAFKDLTVSVEKAWQELSDAVDEAISRIG